MKNTMTQKNILTALTGFFVVSVLVVGGFSIAPFAHAQEDDGGYDFGVDSGSGCCGDVGSYSYAPDTSYDYSPDTYTDYSPDTYTDYSPDTYTSGSYTSTGYLTGSGYLGGSYLSGGGYSVPSNTNVNTNTNVIDNGNSCTAGNSCNTNIVTTNPAPVINNVISNPPSYNYNYPVCDTCGCSGYPSCYTPTPIVYNPPVAYNTAPYITLSQVPYTGLDLGFWGTIAYWGFLILWCLAAAYLVIVKRVQMRIYRAMKNFLFGSTEAVAHTAATPIVAAAAPVHAVAQKATLAYSTADTTDSFILSQINRPRHA